MEFTQKVYTFVPMMNELDNFKSEAIAQNLCAEYTEKWGSCASNKQYIDMGLGIKGIDYICDAIAKGWGMTPEYIAERFKAFINGKYTSQQKGYTSAMYCLFNGGVVASTTALCVISSNIVISVPEGDVVQVYMTGKCKCTIEGGGRAILVMYGTEDNYEIIDRTMRGCKRIVKNERDKYED